MNPLGFEILRCLTISLGEGDLHVTHTLWYTPPKFTPQVEFLGHKRPGHPSPIISIFCKFIFWQHWLSPQQLVSIASKIQIYIYIYNFKFFS